jgi:cyclopropane fatty-acyl-phospholipid synthase-like methyltransferase
VSTFFDVAYEGSPTWEIGRPQAAVVELEVAGEIVGTVLDVGCGTGDNGLFLASRGHEVLGIDLARAAIDRARSKARYRGVAVEFHVANALDLGQLGRTFDSAIDVGLFHTLADEERPVYAGSLRSALEPGGRCFLLCWSERNPWGFGPRRVTRPEIRRTFERGWMVEEIEASRLETKLEQGEVHAWLVRLRRD